MNVKINSESNMSQQQVVGFSDQNSQWVYSVDNRLDSAHKTVDTDDATLSNFFSRPIKIASINWTVGATFGTTVNPWQLYFENLRVINRLTNYNVLRAKLCVRIMINGNGFHYGRALASYRPLHNEDEMVAWRYGLVPQDIIGASQRMHVWIDPTKSQGGTLCLPYVYYKNGMSIPEQEWREMGELDIASVTTLEHANGGTDSVTISVFAWAEDVSLSIPTVAEPGALAPQASEYEEAASGPISGPAHSASQIARALSVVPSIKPMALATEMAMSTLGNIAKLFGMSRPVDAGPIVSVKPSYVGNLANTNVVDTSTKLTFDVKQELTIDPVATGLGPTDEMAFSSIASRESYLTQFSWPTTAVPETLLWNCRVTPALLDQASPSGFTEYHLTPVAWVAQPFENWRGTINFRFQIVASAFHKGRIKVVYDPYYNSSTEYNVQYTHVIDLAKERDFTVSIDWGQELSFLDHNDNLTVPFSTALLGGAAHEEANGIVGIYVVNDLTTPSAVLSDVSVLVSVYASDNFEVVNPNGSNIETKAFFQPQAVLDHVEFKPQASTSGVEFRPAVQADEDLTQAESAPISTLVETSLGVADNNCDVYKIYFGDPVASIRQIAKRYVYHRSFAPPLAAATTSIYFAFQNSNFPEFRGYDPNSYYNAATPSDPTPFTFAYTTPVNWFTPLFLCRRGGMRIKYVYESDEHPNAIMSVTRDTENGATRLNLASISTYPGGTVSRSRLANSATQLYYNRFSGGHTTHLEQNPTLEVEFPFATRYRFSPGRKKNLREIGSEFTQQHTLFAPTSAVSGRARAAVFVSAAEDFSLSFFQSCPVVWEQSTPSASNSL
jgi:hypothetical protein